MILEGIVTTTNPDGTINIAPMGPRVGPAMDRFILRPFRTSNTCRNLIDRPEGVLHVTDDALLVAKTAIGRPVDEELRPADTVAGSILKSCCRYYEFRVRSTDFAEERVRFDALTTAQGRVRDFFGFNRAKHAVLEAAILATRAEWLSAEQLASDFSRLAEIVAKTGGEDETAAMELLTDFVRDVVRRRGLGWDGCLQCVP